MECLGNSACFLFLYPFDATVIQIFAFVYMGTIFLCLGTMTTFVRASLTLISNLFKEETRCRMNYLLWLIV